MVKKRASSRVAARKVKDKWKAKAWYNVHAPPMFDSRHLAETMADEPEKLYGRVMEVTLQDITNDFSKMHIKLRFRVDEVKENDAYTTFIGHDMTSDYIRRLTRRKRSKMDGVFDVRTKDGAIVRVKPMAVTDNRIQNAQRYILRSIMGEVITETARRRYLDEFIGDMVGGALAKRALRDCKKIYPLKRIEIRKSELIQAPTEERPEPVKEEEPEAVEEAKAEEVSTEEPLEEEPKAEEETEEEVAEEEASEEEVKEEEAEE